MYKIWGGKNRFNHHLFLLQK